MKLALLGARDAGKTTSFTALHHLSYNEMGVRGMTPEDVAEAKQRGVTAVHSLRIDVEDSALKRTLLENAALLTGDPMQFPAATAELDRAHFRVRYEFLSLAGATLREYERSVDLYDPAGEGVRGAHRGAREIQQALSTCDGAIVYLSAEHFLDVSDANDKDEVAQLRAQLATGAIMELLDKMRSRMPSADLFPICFVLSQADRITTLDAVDRVKKLLWNKILYPISMSRPWLLMSVCHVSVVNPKTERFKTMNVEWPYLFSTMGVTYRNSLVMRALARQHQAAANAASARAKELRELYDRSKFEYFLNWVGSDGKSFVKEGADAARYMTESGRAMKIHRDDDALMCDVVAQYAQDQDRSGAGFLLKQGNYLNGRDLLEQLRDG